MPQTYVLNMKKILNSIKIHSLTKYSLNDQIFEFNYDIKIKSDSSRTENILLELKDIIYHIYHCRKDIYSFYTYYSEQEVQSNDTFVDELSNANNGMGMWDAGWCVKDTRGKQMIVEKDGLTLWANRHEFWCGDAEIKNGVYGYLKIHKELRALSPGFYVALGNTTPQTSNSYHIKIYWNIQLHKAPFLMKIITTILNHSNIPFQFKVLNSPVHYPRSDSAVLYVDKDVLMDIRKPMSTIFQRARNYLNYDVSFFSKKLANGVGLAEDVDNNEGFGQRISRIIAYAIVDIHSKGIQTTREKLAILYEKLQSEGISIKNPHLLSGSTNDYDPLLKGVFT